MSVSSITKKNGRITVLMQNGDEFVYRIDRFDDIRSLKAEIQKKKQMNARKKLRLNKKFLKLKKTSEDEGVVVIDA